MLLWILIALLTGTAVLAVLLPLGRPAAVAEPEEAARRFHRDQLAELERDQAEGRIGPEDARAARAEIGRRLLAGERRDASPLAPPNGSRARRAVAIVALLGVPLLSLALYASLGAPHLPARPLAARLGPASDQTDIAALVAKVEAHLAASPEDGRGWDVLAPVYLRLGRASEAERAYRSASRLLGSTAERQSGLGEAILARESEIVTAEARAAFEAANVLEPRAAKPRFYLALAKAQEGDVEGAEAGWRALLADAPADAPWRRAVEEALAGVGGGSAPGPTAQEVAAAQQMAPADRANMIAGMVDGLAERLKGNPDDIEGWLRLIRSYAVLGRPEDASAAAAAALEGVSAAEGRKRVEALMAELQLPPAESATP